MRTVYTKQGGRTVELYLPFELDGKRHGAIEFGPIRLDHTLRWQEGQFKTLIGLMADVAGVDEKVIRYVAYPDVDRMMAVFVDMLPPEIRDAIGDPTSYRQLPQIETPSAQEVDPPSQVQPDELGPAPEPAPNINGNAPDQKFRMDLPQDTPDQELTPTERDILGIGVDLHG